MKIPFKTNKLIKSIYFFGLICFIFFASSFIIGMLFQEVVMSNNEKITKEKQDKKEIVKTNTPLTPTIIVTNTLTPTSISVFIPTNTPTPNYPPIVDSNIPFGVVNINCDSIEGFAFDPLNKSRTIQFVFNYSATDAGPRFDGNGGHVGMADKKSPEVNKFYNLEGNHGFYYKVEDVYKINKPVTFKVYAFRGINDGIRPEMIGSPKTITCSP